MKKTRISILRYVSIYLPFKISTKFIFFMNGELNHFLPLSSTPLSIHCSQWYTINVSAANCLGLYVWVKLCKLHFISLTQLFSVSFISSRMTRLLRFYDKFLRINSIPSTYVPHCIFIPLRKRCGHKIIHIYWQLWETRQWTQMCGCISNVLIWFLCVYTQDRGCSITS